MTGDWKSAAFLSEHSYRGLSASRVLRVKARILAKFLAQVSRHPLERASRLRSLRVLNGSKRHVQALVLGLGGSAASLNGPEVARLQQAGELEVFAVNAFALSNLSAAITPDHYVLTDPAYFGGDDSHYKSTSRASPNGVWDYLIANQSIALYIPHDKTPPSGIDRSRVRYVNALGLQGFTRSVSPMRARGYLAITAYTALAVAGWLGYARILILGIDNTQFRSLCLSERGRVALRASHLYTKDDGTANEVGIFASSGVAGFFEDVGRLFADLRLFSHLPIQNLDGRTLVDAFPIAPDRRSYLVGSDHP